MAKENYPSLTEVVKQVAEQQHLQSAEIEKNKIILFQLQVRYQELEKEMDSIMLEMKTAEREIYLQDDAIQVTKYHCESLEAEVGALYAENMKLRFDTETIQEEYEMTSARNSKYREKIKAHKSLFWEMESKMPIVIELAKKKAIVTELRAKKEELMSDLQNPEGSAIKQVQEEIALIKQEITSVKDFINKKTDLLEEIKKAHAKLRKEIEVQNKRYDAILKRLHCQLNKLHSNKRQWHWNIQQMEKKAEELRKCLGEVELQINI
ncbi:coiled-coil domain-containing protein 122 isoform X1 [Gallus gallus]|uniref:Coiled-coil domain containing 122 n=1 Tax=Gallus gallus TaxID=9031 RepID=F1NXE0_CHICK|nr:coiled-coil domain-containing protein 122 isoform X1 [Gallus gallus]XP_040513826.2 coiled-coil domain-containing protein 122 isoform X1 [Gallus gallus]XP_040513842.1 coiled-coil domain-containing protein 122 isoform X1 [Gallus gallus]XP_040513851.1 coiled-coil domain-containing protein 122 isoform X1 [Gallus gallus]XP_040513862.1 coiled-coil domain-containing protein 122 isoform X1 [Gallus gallus]